MSRLRGKPAAPSSPGEPPAFGPLLDSLRPRICGILNRYEIPEVDAEDLLQETCLLLVLRNRQIRNPPAWFLATLANRCRMYWRSTHRERLRCVALSTGEAAGASDEQVARPAGTGHHSLHAPAERVLLRHELRAALRELPRRHALLVVLHLVLGYPKEEAASLLGYRPVSARQTLKRACRFLRARLRKP